MATRGMVLGGRYRLLDVLGDGGMARVFRAEDGRLNRTVAVKVLHQQYLGQPEFVRRFEQEAQLAAGLSHPNIVAIYDVGREDDTYFIVMEYVEGSSLKALITREAPFQLDRTIAIMRQIGLALDYAHAHGVVHRDIKPENILLTPAYHVKVSDFGIARALTSPGQTATGMVLGSVSYFSPEQAQGKPATAESDLYSSGIVLYEMLTGHLPFTADNPLATAMQHITQPPRPPRTYVPALSPAVDTVVLKALNKNPAARFHSGAALADALTVAARAPAARSVPQAAPAPTPGRVVGAPRLSPQQIQSARTLPAAPAAPRRRAPVLPLVLFILLGGGVAYAAMHEHDIGTLFAGAGAPATSTPTATASATTLPPSPSATQAPAVLGPPSATPAPPSATPVPPAASSAGATARPSATPTPSTSTATPAPSATPRPPATTRPTQTVAAGSPARISADITTASAYSTDALRVPYAVDPRDIFSSNAGQVVAVIHIHNYPRGARVGARWTFPNGAKVDYYIGERFSTYVVYEAIGPKGRYTVSALVDGKVVGSHGFTVTGGAETPRAGASDPAPTAGPGAQQEVASLTVPDPYRRARWLARHRGRGRRGGGNDGGDAESPAVYLLTGLMRRRLLPSPPGQLSRQYQYQT